MRVKKILALALTIILSSSLSACNNEKVEQSPVKITSSLKGKVVIWASNSNLNSLKDSAINFKKNNPKVEFQFVDIKNTEVYDKLTTALSSGKEAPDVVNIEDNHIPALVSKFPDGFINLSDQVNPIKDRFISAKISEVTVDGKIIAFPWNAVPSAMFYRRDIFKQVGIDVESIKTWENYIDAAKRLAVKTKGKVKMVAIDERDDMMYRQLINQLGAFYFDKDGKPVLNGEESIKAMSLIKKLKDEGICYSSNGINGLIAAVKNGSVASIPLGVWWTATLQNECKNQNGKWGVMKFPAFEAGGKTASSLSGSSLMITKASKNKEAAREFVQFAATDIESLIHGFTYYNLYPSYIPCYSETEFNKGVAFFGGQKVWELFSEIANEIPSINFTASYEKTRESVINAQTQILLKNAPVKLTMDALQIEELQKEVENKTKTK